MTPERERAIREILQEAFAGMPLGMAIESASRALLALPDPVRAAAEEVVEARKAGHLGQITPCGGEVLERLREALGSQDGRKGET